MLTFPLFFSKNCICEKNVLSLHTFLQSKRKMIKHDGIIIALNEDGTALVRIVQTSACSACKAKAMCASAESAEKEMTAVLLGDEQWAVGNEVEVMVQQKMGWKAVVLAYLLPFFVMLAVMFVGNGLLAIGDGATGLLGDEAKREAVLGTVALCAMAVYYLVLGMFKDKLQKEFSFTAKKK
jgi:sigma-E factor negative regulatory protein RseC